MTELKRSLGLPMLVFYGTGVILGAGIYSIIGKAAGSANESLWISFIIAAASVSLTALSYAELATMFPKAGAEYIYLSNAFSKRKWIGFAVGLAMAFSGAATASAVSIAFAGYLGQFVSVSPMGVSLLLLIGFTGISILGINISAWTNVLFTLIEVGGLGIIIYLGFQSEEFGSALSAMPHLGTLSGAALIVFSFFGFENLVTLSEEAKNPKRDIPRAILISLAISTVVYILVGLAALSLVDPQKLSESDAPLMLVAQTASQKFGVVLGIVALFSTANTALLSMIGGSRILFGMSKSKALPKVMAHVLPVRQTPWVASLFILGISLALLPLGKIEAVASVSSLTTMFAFCAVNIALVFLRFSDPQHLRPFRVPFAIGKLPILPILGAISSLIFMTQFSLTVYVVGIALLILATIIYIWKAKGTKK